MLLEFEKVKRSIICQVVSFITDNLDEKMSTISYSIYYQLITLPLDNDWSQYRKGYTSKAALNFSFPTVFYIDAK